MFEAAVVQADAEQLGEVEGSGAVGLGNLGDDRGGGELAVGRVEQRREPGEGATDVGLGPAADDLTQEFVVQRARLPSEGKMARGGRILRDETGQELVESPVLLSG